MSATRRPAADLLSAALLLTSAFAFAASPIYTAWKTVWRRHVRNPPPRRRPAVRRPASNLRIRFRRVTHLHRVESCVETLCPQPAAPPPPCCPPPCF